MNSVTDLYCIWIERYDKPYFDQRMQLGWVPGISKSSKVTPETAAAVGGAAGGALRPRVSLSAFRVFVADYDLKFRTSIVDSCARCDVFALRLLMVKSEEELAKINTDRGSSVSQTDRTVPCKRIPRDHIRSSAYTYQRTAITRRRARPPHTSRLWGRDRSVA